MTHYHVTHEWQTVADCACTSGLVEVTFGEIVGQIVQRYSCKVNILEHYFILSSTNFILMM